MKSYLITFFLLYGLLLNAQEKYSDLTQQALDLKWNAKSDSDNKRALSLLEKAFLIYPDSLTGSDIHEASLLSTELNQTDKAFKYLNMLLKMKFEHDEYPTWHYIIGNTSSEDYKNLHTDSRWSSIKEQALSDRKHFFDDLEIKEKEFYNRNEDPFSQIKRPKELFKALKNNSPFKEKKDRNYSIIFNINDTVRTSYFIHLPKNYSPEKKYPLMFFLHGAVRSSQFIDFQISSWNLGGWNKYYTKYADLNDVILVFPKASKKYNWMLSDDGFFMIPEILKQIKTTINVDDDKVFISGHSNGGTGSFSYLMKQPTTFAGFYGFNTYPKVFTGGTFIENIKNRSFINFSTDEDYYYPPNANDDFTKLVGLINADYQEFRYVGFPHWFPQFEESEPAYQILFDDLMKRNRNPFSNEVIWEFDDERYGEIDWVSNMKLDTLSSDIKIEQRHNFIINKWLNYDDNDSLVVENVYKQAFDFPRKSGKIIGNYCNNVFYLTTSNIKSFSINISPEMINMNKRIKVFVNGKLYFDKKVTYNKVFMLSSFEKNRDRTQLWVNQIPVVVK